MKTKFFKKIKNFFLGQENIEKLNKYKLNSKLEIKTQFVGQNGYFAAVQSPSTMIQE